MLDTYRTILRAYLPLAALMLVVTPSNAQKFNRFASWALQDGFAISQQFLPLAPLFTVTGGSILLTGLQYDEPISDHVQRLSGRWWSHYLEVTNEFGGPRMAAPLVGTFGISLVTGDKRFQDAAFTAFEAWLYAGLITQGLKRIFGRYRPEESSRANRFKPFSGHSSFPSGHATAAFAWITPWVLYYPHPLTYGLFTLSVGTAIARIAYDKHWPSDVIVGGAIGFLTAKWLVNRHTGARSPGKPVLQAHLWGSSFSVNVMW